MRLIKASFFLILLSFLCSISYGQSYIWQGSTNQFVGQLGGLGSNKWLLLPNDTIRFTSALRKHGLLAIKAQTLYYYDSIGGSWQSIGTGGLSGLYIQNQTAAKQSANYSIISGRQDSVIINTPTSTAAPNDKWVLKNFFNRTTGAGDTVGARLGFYYTSNDLAQHKLGFFGGGGSFVLPGHALDEIAHSTGFYAGDYDQSSSTPFGLVMWCANRVCSLGYNFNTGYNLTSTHNKAAIYFDSLFRFTTIGLDNYEYNINGSLTTLSKITKGYGDSAYVSLFGTYSNPSWITSLAWSKITGTPTTLAGYGITDAASSSIPWQTVMTNGNFSTISQRTGFMTAPTTNPAITEATTTEFLGRQAVNNIYWYSSNNSSTGGVIWNINRARDTATNTALTSGDDFISMQLRGTDGNAASAVLGFAMVIEATNAWSSTSRPTQMIISNTTTGSTAQVRAFRLTDHDILLGETGVKNVIIGTTTNANNARLNVAGLLNTENVEPVTDDTYYLGENSATTPHAYKGVILKDTTNGNYYRIEVINGVITATAL